MFTKKGKSFWGGRAVDEVDEVEDPVTVEVVMLLVTVLYMPGNQ